MKNVVKLYLACLTAFNFGLLSAQAADQTWNDADANNVWNLANTNWDSSSIWTNNNNAIFGGTGETVDLGAAISVGNMTFNSDGYSIADSDSNGSFTIAGNPTVITVATNCTATLSDAIEGSGGFTKEGPGTLEFTTGNSYSGVTTLKDGILKLANNIRTSLGQTGSGNELIIEPGAALDLNSAFTARDAQHITASGSGFSGSGAIFNSAANVNYNDGFGDLTLAGDTTISVDTRWDLCGGYNVYGNGYTLTKIGSSEIAVSRPVNNCPIIINRGAWTAQNADALGGTDYPTYINNAGLYVWGTYTFTERIIFTGSCNLREGTITTATFSGHLTVSNNVYLGSNNYAGTNGLAITGYVDGPGGFTKGNMGWCYITCASNSYSGVTQVNSSRNLWVGHPDGSVEAARIGTGQANVYGYLFYDNTGTYTISNVFAKNGTIIVRNGGEMTLSSSTSIDSPTWYLSDGSLTLTNGASLTLPNRNFTMSDKAGASQYATATSIVPYPVIPANTEAELTITDGCLLKCNAFICGNGSSGTMTSIIHHIGGTVETTGSTAENNGFRIGHYPGARTTYNLSGGSMICGADQDICMGTDGQGWLNVTGGDIYTSRIMLNERDNSNGYGRFTLAGGTLHLGSPTVTTTPTNNAINTDSFPDSTYDVELGGSGGEIEAVTDIYITVDATLYGTNNTAVTFNSNGNTIYFTGELQGNGGFNVTGGGTMVISSANNPCDGKIRITDGSTLKLCVDDTLPNATVYVGAGSTLDFCGYGQKIGGVYGPGKVIYPGTLIILH